MTKHEMLKEMLRFSSSNEEADKVLETHANIHGTQEKITFLRGMFGVSLGERCIGGNLSSEEILKDDYSAILATIRHMR